MTRYLVTAQLVTAKVPPPVNLGYFYRGTFLPDGVLPESIDHLLALDMIRPIDELEEIR